MTVVKARVAGGWVPLSAGTGQVWNTAWGVVAVGTFFAAGSPSLPVGVTKLTNDIMFQSIVGRRYRFVLQVRIVGTTTGNGVNFLPLGPGVGGSSWDTWVSVTGSTLWAPLHTEVLFNGNGTNGAFYWNANNAGTTGVAVYLDSMSTVYIEDVGPVAGFNPVTPAVAWTPIPLQGNWAPYDPAGSWQVPSYRKIGDIVYCRGLAKNASNDATVGVLPVGYRPTGNVMVAAWLSWNGSAGRATIRLEISPSGVILFGTAYGLPTGTTNPAVTSCDHLNLDNLIFSTT
jgi:hypothetical protein